MPYSLNVDFSRRLGKSIGVNKISSYEIKKKINEYENNLDKRKIFNDFLSEIFKHDLFLCNWLYYEDYDKFLSDFKEYILELDDEYFNIIINSDIHLGNMVDIFWMEKNDPILKEKYNYETALEEHKKAVEKNNYKFDNDDRKYEGFKLILKELTYKRYNQEIYDKLFKLKKELEYARMDDILHMRTELQWKYLYSLRYMYKNVVNNILKIEPNNIFSFDEPTPISQLYKIKKNIEDYLMFYQESTEGLDWYNPYSNKPIENIEYFPRETSKPPHEYAYAEYYDLKNTSFLNFEEMLNQRKKRNEEIQNNINERFNKLHKLMQERNDKVKNIAKYISYGIKYGYYASIIIGISVISYYFFN